MANERWHGIPLHGKLPCRQVCYDSSVCRVDSSFVKSIKSAGQEEQYATHGWWRRAPVAPAPDKSSATVPTPGHRRRQDGSRPDRRSIFNFCSTTWMAAQCPSAIPLRDLRCHYQRCVARMSCARRQQHQ
jgi:hypothetical protein